MSNSRPERRPSITRPHPARTAAAAALQAEQAEQAEQDDAAPAELTPTAEPDNEPSADVRPPPRERLSSGRVSYAGRAVTIYFPSAEDKDRAQAAFAARGGMEGYTSASEWMADVILERTEQWEKDYNRGEPFTEVLERRQARRKGR